MNILFTCGGTGGHINPAIAVADTIRMRHPDAELRFAGSPHGMEARLVPRAGYPFIPIVIKGFYRSLSPKAIMHNLSAVACMLRASSESKRILNGIHPDLVLGTGGYVSGPILRTASKLGYRTMTHESNAYPGVTTRLLSNYVDKILLAVPEAAEHLPNGRQTIVVGNPVREEIIFANREESRRELGIRSDRFVLLTFGGSLGAQRVNEAVADIIAWHHQSGRIHHIHATGQYGVELLPRLLKEKGVDIHGRDYIDIREYIDDMARCLAASDLVICRSGASTLSELEAAGRASVLIPSPNVAENHQYHNAMVLEKHGAAIVIEEKDLTGERLCALLDDLISHPERVKSLSRAASSLAIVDACDRIYQEVIHAIQARKS